MNRALLGCAALLLLAACATPTQTFLHRAHRQNFALRPDELESIQFYVSTEILARNEAQPDSPAGVVIVPVGTPGAVLEVGENWMRVSFSEGAAASTSWPCPTPTATPPTGSPRGVRQANSSV